jgi:hypothetical protein
LSDDFNEGILLLHRAEGGSTIPLWQEFLKSWLGVGRKNAIPKAVLHLSTRGANKDSVSRPSAMLVVGVQCAAQKEALGFVVVPFWPFRSCSL